MNFVFADHIIAKGNFYKGFEQKVHPIMALPSSMCHIMKFCNLNFTYFGLICCTVVKLVPILAVRKKARAYVSVKAVLLFP